MRSIKALCASFVMVGGLFTGVAMAEDKPAIEPGNFEAFDKFVTDAKIMPPCTTCHKKATKLVGPSYNAVALYYKDKEGAAELLKEKVLKGGSGTWGPVPMTPNATANPEDVEQLVTWILALEPEGDDKEAAQKEIDAMPKSE